MPARLEWR